MITNEPSGNEEKEDINFKSLDNTKEGIVTDKFNLFYVQSIDIIIKSINDTVKHRRCQH